jgi:hypothetical protein
MVYGIFYNQSVGRAFVEDRGFTVAVFSGEIRSRLNMTARCINSINSQTHDNLQKILVNGGSPPHQTQDLAKMGVDLESWTIVDFPIDCMDIERNNWSAHRWNGAAALHIAEKEFFFAINDDDFLANDFFERMSKLFNKHKSAKTAMGLRVTYNHESNKFGKIAIPKNKKGIIRPECEPGLNVVRELFFRENLSYGPSIGFQPICSTDLIREIGPGFFYNGLYPDCSPYFQVVFRSDTVFDSQAYMYWGLHQNQDHTKWDKNNYWYCTHERVFSMFLKNNLKVFQYYLPNNYKDIYMVKRYFKRRIVTISLFAITKRFSSDNSSKLLINDASSVKTIKFPLLRHLKIILKRPFTLFELLIKLSMLKFRIFFKL